MAKQREWRPEARRGDESAAPQGREPGLGGQSRRANKRPRGQRRLVDFLHSQASARIAKASEGR
jgi:hypothetical protein